MIKKLILAAVLALAGSTIAPSSRAAETDLLPNLQSYASQVTGEFSMIPPDRQQMLKTIALYIKSRNAAGETAQVTFICTANSRRSHFSAAWAQAAALYYNVTNVKIFSGGIQVTACNIRTVDTLRRAGFSVADSTGGTNPVYLVQFSDKAPPMRAFSKYYNQDGNPTNNYLAGMTCANADKNCPIVQGSSMRVGIHYEDPKDADGTPGEQAAYDATCRLIAREMFFIFSQVNS
jgi:hypothetical protein